MDDTIYSINALVTSLVVLLVLSAFFSGSETALMSLNRYRLKHLAKTKRSAKRVCKLLQRPDRLLGLILIGNNFVNISASAIATILGAQLLGSKIGIPVATAILTIVVLIFSETMPKTLAALKPDLIAYPASILLEILLWVLFPIVWIVNAFANGFLKIFGISSMRRHDVLSTEELKVIFNENSGLSLKHRNMLAGILELEKMTVKDIMIPRTEIVGLDLNNSHDELLLQLKNCEHKFLPLYKEDLNNIQGMLATRSLSKMVNSDFSIDNLIVLAQEPYFIPEVTSLNNQLLNFQRNKNRIALVVDEYGDIQGLVTLEDILEEIVGEFTTDMAATNKEIHFKSDGSIIVDGSVNIRTVNKYLGWDLPTDRAKTLNGLVVEYLENIPEAATCVLINNHPIEVLQIQDNMIKTLKIMPKLKDYSNNLN